MNTRSPLRIAAAFWFASALAAQTGPAGHWEGVWNANGRDIRLSLDLARNAKGEWIASMGVPAQNVTGLVVKDLAVTGESVKFMAVELQMAKLDLTLAGGRLTGTFAGRGSSTAIEFQRTGEADVQLPPSSPAVSKDLEGDWAGTLQTPGSKMEITVHFKDQPDGTVLATIDIPATHSVAMPINGVKQAGDKVEFGLKIAHASFEGTLDKGRGELTGQLTHEDQAPMPVTLRKQ
jgi:hypothetical protein